MTASPLQAAVLRLERAILRLEHRPRPAPAPPPVEDGRALELLAARHARLRGRVEETIRALDALIATGEQPA